jgi:hypothetical protein
MLISPVSPAHLLAHNILLIHGRTDTTNKQFGVLITDQLQYWNGSPPPACAAFEKYLTKSGSCCNSIRIAQAMAALRPQPA